MPVSTGPVASLSRSSVPAASAPVAKTTFDNNATTTATAVTAALARHDDLRGTVSTFLVSHGQLLPLLFLIGCPLGRLRLRWNELHAHPSCRRAYRVRYLLLFHPFSSDLSGYRVGNVADTRALLTRSID